MTSYPLRGKALLVGVSLLGALFLSQLPRTFHLGWSPERQAALEAYTVAIVLGTCLWFSGRALQRRDGESHSFAFIPVQWIGVAFVVGSLTSAAFEIWGPRTHPIASTPAQSPTHPLGQTPIPDPGTPAPGPCREPAESRWTVDLSRA